MTPETPTPETDTEEDKHGNGNAMHAHCHDSSHLSGDFADFARRLERERDAARAEIEAMREAVNALRRIMQTTSRELFDTESLSMANAALAKLKPFIKQP